MNKVIKTFLFFFIISVLSIAAISCRSGKTASKSRSATTNKAYVRKKSKSGNKRANHRNTSSTTRRTASTSRSTAPPRAKSSAAVGSKSASGQAAKVIKTARSYLGTPYRYGGSTSKGMDCSGLLCTSFQTIEVKLPRTSQEQAKYGKDIRITDIAPGDLVFFAERKGGSRISHVGMVTTVKGKDEVIFIHSSTSRGVVEDNLFGEYYQKIFVKAIRPF